MTQQMYNWCFTLNNYTDEEIVAIKAIDYKYLVFGYEVGENGTPHLQGYIELTKRLRFGGVKKLFPPRVHLEARRGTAEEAADYCKKDGVFFEEYGAWYRIVVL